MHFYSLESVGLVMGLSRFTYNTIPFAWRVEVLFISLRVFLLLLGWFWYCSLFLAWSLIALSTNIYMGICGVGSDISLQFWIIILLSLYFAGVLFIVDDNKHIVNFLITQYNHYSCSKRKRKKKKKLPYMVLESPTDNLVQLSFYLFILCCIRLGKWDWVWPVWVLVKNGLSSMDCKTYNIHSIF